MRRLRRSLAALACGLLAVAAPAQAEPQAAAERPANALGAAGQKILFGRVDFELAIGDAPNGDDTARDLAAAATPGLLYFVARDLALGLAACAAYADYELVDWPYQTLELELVAGAGINFPLAPGISLFPQLWGGVGYLRSRHDDLPVALPDYTDPAFARPAQRLQLESSEGFASGTVIVPLQFELGAATYVAVGPRVRLRLGFEQASPALGFGISAGVGRYF